MSTPAMTLLSVAAILAVLTVASVTVRYRAARQAARDREYLCLQHVPATFPGRVYGCAKWRKCDDRLIETPPYGDDPPYGLCTDHGLRMDTKIAERRALS